MPTNLKTLYLAYDQGVAECHHPWQFQADVANETYLYSPANACFIKPADGPVEWALPIGGDAKTLDRPAIVKFWDQKYDVVLYAWDKNQKQRVKVFFDSSIEYNGKS